MIVQPSVLVTPGQSWTSKSVLESVSQWVPWIWIPGNCLWAAWLDVPASWVWAPICSAYSLDRPAPFLPCFMPACICSWGLFYVCFIFRIASYFPAAPGFSHLYRLPFCHPSCQDSDHAIWLQEEVAPGSERTLDWELNRPGFWPCSHLSLSQYCASPLFSFAPVSPSIKWKDWPDCWGLFQHSHSMMLWGFWKRDG